jgi:hypothetical protein
MTARVENLTIKALISLSVGLVIFNKIPFTTETGIVELHSELTNLAI